MRGASQEDRTPAWVSTSPGQTVCPGRVVRDDEPVGNATGRSSKPHRRSTAELTSATSQFRFFAGPSGNGRC